MTCALSPLRREVDVAFPHCSDSEPKFSEPFNCCGDRALAQLSIFFMHCAGPRIGPGVTAVLGAYKAAQNSAGINNLRRARDMIQGRLGHVPGHRGNLQRPHDTY